MSETNGFTLEQQQYLQGFASGVQATRGIALPMIDAGTPAGTSLTVGGSKPLPLGPEAKHFAAQDRQVAAGGKLCSEEKAKRAKNGLDLWGEMQARAERGEFPKGTDVFLQKFHGMFFVAPAQKSFMCRLRFPGGFLQSWQFRGLADLADKHAGGYTDVTTRANLQMREIGAADPVHFLLGLRDLGIINTGAGSDNIRNVTASPLSGIDPTELIETLPLARDMHHYILNHRDMYGLPRKFNIAFDGGGAISSLDDTNDIGFHAVRLSEETEELPAGIYFQLTIGGITGHKDFARYTGVLLKPEECVKVAGAIVRVFLRNGDRTNRNKARLKYVLDDWGFDKYLEEVEQELGESLRRAAAETLEPSAGDDRQAHVDVHAQLQPGLNYIGVVVPVGRITSQQMRGLSDIAEKHGNGEIRLTVWQNLLIPNIPLEQIPAAQQAIQDLGLHWQASSVRAGLVACTGNAGCKYAAGDTKRHALQLADYVEERVELDQPVNIHLTGCHHSCAQHYIGDIGLIATNVEQGDDLVEGYHLFVGGGYGERQNIGRELFPSLRFDEVPPTVASMLQNYLERRSEDESFVSFVNRHEIKELRTLFAAEPALL